MMILMMIRRWEDIKVEASEESSSCGHVTSQAAAQAQILSFVIIIIIIVIIIIVVVIITLSVAESCHLSCGQLTLIDVRCYIPSTASSLTSSASCSMFIIAVSPLSIS